MLRAVEIADKRIIVSEHYTVEIIRTGRGIIAEVNDAGSVFNKLSALGSDEAGAMAALMLKVQRAANGECF